MFLPLIPAAGCNALRWNFSTGIPTVRGARYVLNLGFNDATGYLLPARYSNGSLVQVSVQVQQGWGKRQVGRTGGRGPQRLSQVFLISLGVRVDQADSEVESDRKVSANGSATWSNYKADDAHRDSSILVLWDRLQ